MNSLVDEILKGSFDLRVLAGPEPGQETRMDALETARYAYEAEMGGFALVSEHYPTAPVARILCSMYPGLKVTGSIVLNSSVGGLNADALDMAASLGTQVVSMPTSSADHYLSRRGKGTGIRLVNDEGLLQPEIGDILEIVRDRDLTLASGEVSSAEAAVLFKEASARGIRRMIASRREDGPTLDELRELVSLGASAEYTFLSCMPCRAPDYRLEAGELAKALQALGVRHCVVATDFGQWLNPPPAEGMRMAIATLLDAGMGPEDVTAVVKTNPGRLLGDTSI